jgi:hypothetical protein
MTRNPPQADRVTIVAWMLTAVALCLVLVVHLLPALFAGLLVYALVHLTAPYLAGRLSDDRAKLVVVALLAATVVGIVTAASFALAVFIQSDPDRPAALLAQFADMVLRAKETFPAWLAALCRPTRRRSMRLLPGGPARMPAISSLRGATPRGRWSTPSWGWSSAR